MHKFVPGTLFMASILLPVTACASDPAAGQTLHDAICMTCHQSDYYTRKDRSIHSLDALKTRVDNCQSGAGEEWSDAQIDAVTTYLNTRYYKFR